MSIVLVSHPTRQHSHHLAHALHERGWLHGYSSMLPDREMFARLPAWALPGPVRRQAALRLPRELMHFYPLPLLAYKATSRSRNPGLKQAGELFAWAALDHFVARRLVKTRPGVVVGYEMASLRTFMLARKFGIPRILDAAACHYLWQDKLVEECHQNSKTHAGRALRRRKAAEIALADKIICASEMARESYLEAGVDPDKVVVNPVGCESALFTSVAHLVGDGPPRFLFVGMPGRHKGFDLLLKAFARIRSLHPDAQLHVVGDPDRARSEMKLAGVYEGVVIKGKLSQVGVASALGECHCLVLPSRLESFGMVVVEALAAGRPVIVSENVGASEAVVNGQHGWVIPSGDADALFSAMHSVCTDPVYARSMRSACIAKGQHYNWDIYRKRAVEIFRPFCEVSQ